MRNREKGKAKLKFTEGDFFKKGYAGKTVAAVLVCTCAVIAGNVWDAVDSRAYVEEQRMNELVKVYKDGKLNFLMRYGKSWEMVETDFDETRVVVDGLTGGNVFDPGKHELGDEVVSAFMVRGVDKEEKVFSDYQMVTMSGAVRESREAHLLDRMEEELKESGVTDIRVVRKETGITDTYIEMTGKVDGKTLVNYSQYAQIKGKNMVKVLRGTLEREKHVKVELENMVKAMQFQETE